MKQSKLRKSSLSRSLYNAIAVAAKINVFTSFAIGQKQNIKTFTILVFFSTHLLLSCNSFNVGETEVTISKNNSEILIDNFPKPVMGVQGSRTITWPQGFDFRKLDRKIFNSLQDGGFASNYVQVRIRLHKTDNYGEIVKSDWKTIFHYDVQETQKFKDYYRWEDRFGVFQLIRKNEIDIYSTK